MKQVELQFNFELRLQGVSKLVEPIAVFPAYVYCDECDDDVFAVEEIALIDAIRDSLEGKTGSKVFGLDVGDIWVTHVPNSFNPLTFDINGKIYFCVQVEHDDND